MKLCGFDVGIEHPIFLIAGPCVIESQQMAIDTAGQLKEMCLELGIPFIYKSINYPIFFRRMYIYFHDLLFISKIIGSANGVFVKKLANIASSFVSIFFTLDL